MPPLASNIVMRLLVSVLRGFRRFCSVPPVPTPHPLEKKEVQVTGIPYSPSGLYAMFFTCKVCNTRSAKTFSKKSYHTGVVLIRCDGCQKLHLVADHLGWFRDKGVTIEDIMKEKGEDVMKLAQEKPVLEFSLDNGQETPS